MAADRDWAIGGRYLVNLNDKLPGAGGGLETFGVTDQRAGPANVMAVQVRQNAPPRAAVIGRLAHFTSAGVLLPISHGPAPGSDGRGAYYVICTSPPGPTLASAGGPWPEALLLEHVLRPVATTLAQLEAHGVTHRAIRPDNLFSSGSAHPAILGVAWAAPPASLQPAIYEPQYSGMCVPSGRGDGTIADDVYALGVTLVALLTGKVPLDGLAEVDVVKRKLDLGCYAAVVGEHRLPPITADLVRGMLAEDPAHRPPPHMLLDISAARSRRLAARQRRRAPRALQIGDVAAADARSLAFAMHIYPDEGMRLLRTGSTDNWVRRILRDVPLAGRIDEAVRQRSGAGADDTRAAAMLLMQVIALLDPTAPLCWHGVALWPDGLGPALVGEHRRAERAARLEDLVRQNAFAAWATARTGHLDVQALRLEAQQWRGWLSTAGPAGGLARLCYELNPLSPCASPLLGTNYVARLLDIPPALELASANEEARKSLPIDADIAAFIAAHRKERVIDEGVIPEGKGADGLADQSVYPVIIQFRILAKLQLRLSPPRALPGLAGWLVEHSAPLIAGWNSRAKRASLEKALQAMAPAGQLAPMLALFDDEPAREADRQGLKTAAQYIKELDAELERIGAGSEERRMAAKRLGQEIAAGGGLTTLAAVLAGMALG